MAHEFVLAEDLHRKLEQAAGKLPKRETRKNGRIPKENQEIMKTGACKPEGGIEQRVPAAPTSVRVKCPADIVEEEGRLARVSKTNVCCTNVDTLTAALNVNDALALNFANADTPGGGYLHGARAQEEDLCRCLPQLHPALQLCDYPIGENEALVTRGLLAVRQPNSYDIVKSLGTCNIVTAAMPICNAMFDKACDAQSPEWYRTVTLRVRTVFRAAKMEGFRNLILGAWGCGAFGNPPGAVAKVFWDQLKSPEFVGCFETVVFAVIDPLGDGNLDFFNKAMMDNIG